MRRPVMVLCTAVIVAACGSDGGETTTTTEAGSTVRQVASVVAQYQPAIEEAVAFELDECNTIECLSATATVNRIGAAADRADEFHLALWDLKPYPVEVRSLTERTIEELNAMRDESDALEGCLSRTGGILHADAGPDCEASLEEAQSTYLDDLPKLMRAWAPYL